MKRKLPSRVVAFSLGFLPLLAGPCGWGQGMSPAVLAADEVSKDEGLIEHFATSRDPGDLQRAFGPLATNLSLNGSNRPPEPQVILLWLKLFSTVDAVRLGMSRELRAAVVCDGAYPDGSAPDGPCGPSPPTVSDRGLRSRYEAAISQNESAIRSHNDYARISTIEQRLDSSFWTWANGLYDHDPGSEAKLLDEATVAGCTEARLEWINDITMASAGAFPPAESIVLVPTKLNVIRDGEQISVKPDLDFPQGIQLLLDPGRTMGVETDLRLYPKGGERPAQPQSVEFSSTVSALGSGTEVLKAGEGRVGAPGNPYVVEEELTIFETDIPPEHMWMPKGSPNYKVLWRGLIVQALD